MHEEVKSFGYRKNKNVSAFVFVALEHFHIPPGLGGMWFNKKKKTETHRFGRSNAIRSASCKTRRC